MVMSRCRHPLLLLRHCCTRILSLHETLRETRPTYIPTQMEREQFSADRAFIQFSSLALVSLCACTTFYYYAGNHTANSTRAAGMRLFAAFDGSRRGYSVPGGLVLCVVTCESGHRDHAFVWRGPRGSSVQQDLQYAMSTIPYVLIHPREYRHWPRLPFDGPYVAIVVTKPENFALREAIRKSWGKEDRYPRGTFRLLFFVAEPAPGLPRRHKMKKILLSEAYDRQDMLVESHWLHSTRAMMLEWAPEYSNASKLLLWTRDNAKINARRLLRQMQHLSEVPGDVFGRISTAGANDATSTSKTRKTTSPWNRLEQCAYFIKMAALVRLSSVYDAAPKASTNDEVELVTADLANSANLTLVAIDRTAKCTATGMLDGHGNRTDATDKSQDKRRRAEIDDDEFRQRLLLA